MASQEQCVQTHGALRRARQPHDLKLRVGLQFISSLLLPLTLGVFTVVITFQQQSAAKQQRDEDRMATELQRAEDRNASLMQRREDQDASRLLREQERDEAERLRQQERNLDDQRYKNNRFDTYIKEMGELLKESHGSLTLNKVTATIARAKTLTTFRQLDAQRNIQIILFLYEAEQLSGTPIHHSVDLSTAKLVDMDFRHTAVDEKQLDNITLTSIFLSNSTFIGIKMAHVNFSSSQFYTANFSLGSISDGNFSSASFSNADFSSTRFDDADLSYTNLSSTAFERTQFKNINFSSAKLDTSDFHQPNSTL
ncbi:unnamed protein product [Rotaria magnacalcarata]|uniref:Pentapeptide repeat-containing protein n=2 Tax=Rotaria magnacalcarata TaxID=392030 RepID=A0A816QMH7_9BILA|nr:unnamed protein product [Rotaria magnacalcarata]CAF2062913.1 unnamed protein product [Rotaria magnacalcarata]CAF3965004.1 unnamed protein product [Rotaria magnacalcarata]